MPAGPKQWIALALFAVCIGALFAGCTSSKTAKKDVEITSCTASPTGGRPKARGTIRNSSSKDSAYGIRVKFVDSSGNSVGEGAAAVAKVEPGKTANWDVTGLLNAKGRVTCELATVTRTAVP